MTHKSNIQPKTHYQTYSTLHSPTISSSKTNYKPKKPNSIISHQSITNTSTSFQNPIQLISLDLALESKLIDSIGQEIKFNQILDPNFRTIVIFLRHFRCPFCQQYIKKLSEISLHNQNLMMFRYKIRIILIGQGDYKMINPYKALYNCPFPIYSDPNQNHPLYKSLGMQSGSFFTKSPSLSSVSYLDHLSIFELFIMALKVHLFFGYLSLMGIFGCVQNDKQNATKMPLRYGGDLKQLGGEFVFEPIKVNTIKRKPIKFDPYEQSFHPNPIQETQIHHEIKKPKPIPGFLKSKLILDFSNQISSSTNSYPPDSPSTSSNFSTSSTSTSYSIWSGISSSEKKSKFQCRFVHRMRNMRDHTPLEEVLMAAGIKIH
ncbi:uncharacterized protein MELLADRAFT_101809 [Melampsora larici-populina 98AG31]|uniref:Alkyl hydroperoxide reductase subunit C/ Thiol specific antioxidant domain-containing protein n=1 Tax=Melampsora larici-populina (strain 98AG31 / pathotype 3-4-7) TaxID=747676 RepID=F4R4Z8_MELLP|nr:uncharacterized protein MELLADRAFT_101809 [Melampsora larici-populina 98AG31]EGG11969.1 hypothetical protein MELLADRAFT_101809 [Melampsora larici-populina 98AG31]